MFHCSVSTAASLFSTSQTAVNPFLSRPQPRIDDHIKMKQNHCLVSATCIHYYQEMRKRRRRKDGACIVVRGSEILIQGDTVMCHHACILFLPSFSSIRHPDIHKQHRHRILKIIHTHTHTNTSLLNRGHIQQACLVWLVQGVKQIWRLGHKDLSVRELWLWRKWG